MLVSHLTCSGLQSHSAEVFGRVDHDGGLFWKGLFVNRVVQPLDCVFLQGTYRFGAF